MAGLGKCGDCDRIPSLPRLPPAIEPGDPQRCGSTARVTGSCCQRVLSRPLSHDTFSIFVTAYALSVTAAPCQLSHRESQGAGLARPAHRNICAGNLTVPPTQSPPGTPDTHHHPYPCITCINIPPRLPISTPHPPGKPPLPPPAPPNPAASHPPDPRKHLSPFALFCPGIAISCGKAPWFSKKMVHNKK